MMNEKNEGKELAFMRYVKRVPPLVEADRALKYECLHWTTAGSGEGKHNVEKKGKDGDAMVAGEWLETIPFQSIVSTLHAAWAFFAIHPLTGKAALN